MISRFNPRRIPFRVLTAVILLWGSPCQMPLRGASAADETGRETAPKTPVTIAADELVGDESAKSAEFIGNVKVIRGEYTLTTDRLKVFFDAIEKPVGEKNGPRANIREIVAEGHVRVLSDELTANANRATYDRKTRTLVLTGENTEVYRDGSKISGNQITIFLDTEKVIVSGNSENRVQGVFKIPSKN